MRGLPIRVVVAVVVGAAVGGAAKVAALSASGGWTPVAILAGVVVVIVAVTAAADARAMRAFRRTMRDDFIASGRVRSAEEFDELVRRHGTLGAVAVLRDDGR